MQTDYESNQSVEVISGDTSHEVEFEIGLTCTAPFSAGYFDPYHGGEPPSGPEFDLTTIAVLVPRVNRKPGQSEFDTSLSLTWNQFVALVGEDIANKLFNNAYIEAAENGDF